MLCYVSCETEHDVTKNFYQCSATHFGMIYFYNESWDTAGRFQFSTFDINFNIDVFSVNFPILNDLSNVHCVIP